MVKDNGRPSLTVYMYLAAQAIRLRVHSHLSSSTRVSFTGFITPKFFTSVSSASSPSFYSSTSTSSALVSSAMRSSMPKRS